MFGVWRYIVASRTPKTELHVGGQLHDPAALPPPPGNDRTGGWEGPRAGLEFSLAQPAAHPVTMSTTL